MEPTDTQLDNALEYSRVLSEVEREIAAAFTGHFSGKPGMYVPYARPVQMFGRQVITELSQSAADAIEQTHDYPAVLPVFHAVLTGSKPLDAYRAAVVAEYMRLHAADVAELRSGLDAPLSYVAPSIPAFLMREAA